MPAFAHPDQLDLDHAAAGTTADRKRHGVHYTPSELARFVARRVLRGCDGEVGAVLDPACGDGELLLAVAAEAAAAGLAPPKLVGVDRDGAALGVAAERLEGVRAADVSLDCVDFLEATHDPASSAYDIVVSNPPYVRTQILGAARARELGRRFSLEGRVDLYHAFVAAMTRCLADHGVLGLLCSNRFISTRGGESLRTLLTSAYELSEVWDLGDSKLFEAAVLPAVLVGERAVDGSSGTSVARFTRVYESGRSTGGDAAPSAILRALEDQDEAIVEASGRAYRIERGSLMTGHSRRPWQLSTPNGDRWLRQIRSRASGRLGDVGSIRVGIKTTADKVFIRRSWGDLPVEETPEPDLLRPLLTHHVAARWAASTDPAAMRSVLYTHKLVDGVRSPIDLGEYPRASAYLSRHRTRLEGRQYVLKARRQWYEIWVPQDPAGWASPKLVWPDIAEEPRFSLDESGAVVNGDCYWLSCGDASPELQSLLLAVANSTVALRYYDLCCGNRLYSGRRRFITQYLEELPIPDVSGLQLSEIGSLVDALRTAQRSSLDEVGALERTLNSAVAELFGVEEVGG